MRGFLASSIGVVAAAALAVPLVFAAPALAESAPETPTGSTRSLPLVPLGPEVVRGSGVPGLHPSRTQPETRGLTAREVEKFSLVGVVWDDAGAELVGRVQVRTRDARTALWSDWQDVEIHNSDHGADPDAAERGSGRVRGATAPLWVGESDGVEVRVTADTDTDAAGHTGTGTGPDTGPDSDPQTGTGRAPARLPSGLRIELIDPGMPTTAAGDAKNGTFPDGDDKGENAAPGMSMATAESSSANVPMAPMGADEIKALNKADSTADAVYAGDAVPNAAAAPYIGPRPRIVTRKGWGANESLREPGFVYTRTVKAAFVHHSASGNNYACKDAPAVLRSLYRYHVVSSGWRDFGYNFAVDKCGTVYEGRAGGVAKAVLGAHTMGFNTDSMGVVVLGTYSRTAPPAPALDAVARLTAWKLGLFNRDPRARTTLVSGGGNRYPKGRAVAMNVISGHRDGFATECPGKLLYGKLPPTRTASAKLQGRP
ncbi:peptidoglycan recognition protein family protein [Streptomyces antimicrobicus]|uniref:Peptidoglycan recognition protein n=1 Tax=Streptomyces antimicrobicus TaxID=2883108 RepID=A0ABS8B3D4_9ACTN|nr:peptidoglycan recognition protein [Streptomyces antimicrobicus]MCB5179115.1 peptidoglycan recognition protein [Streptomyces antimicrobicus]